VSRIPRWLIIEDGHEYIDRFRRFGGGRLALGNADSLDAAILAMTGAPPDGLLFDLDFRRTAPALLIDEAGASAASLPPLDQQRLAAQQGIYILMALRARGVMLPAILCADLDDAEQRAYLESKLAPLQIVGSNMSLRELLALLETP
jgi:hypothetical protein